MIDDFVKQHPDVISKVTYSKAPAPELAGKIKAQQNAEPGRHRPRADRHRRPRRPASSRACGPTLLPEVRRPAPRHEGLPAARRRRCRSWPATAASPSPTTRPARCWSTCRPRSPNPPTTAEELLAYAKANPGKVMYARPANSGPGRTFLMGLPYILGDKDPKDPVNGWDKTWAYLKELNQYVDFYPSGTGETMKNLANGSANVIATTTGWDINPRVLGTVPKEAEVSPLKGFHWVTDAHYAVVPRASRPTSRPRSCSCCSTCSPRSSRPRPTTRATSTPARRSRASTLSMAPQESQDAIKEFGRAGVRRADRRQPDRGAAATRRAWSPRSTCGTARSAAAKVKKQ